MLQAAPMNCPQGPRAFAGGEQVLLAAALVADPAHWPVIEGAAREGGASAGHQARNRHHEDGSLALCPSDLPQADTCFNTLDGHSVYTVVEGGAGRGPQAPPFDNIKKEGWPRAESG